MPEQDESAAVTAEAEPTPDPAEVEGGAAIAPAEETDRPVVADEVLLASAALAQRALLEVTPPETVGSVVGHIVEDEHVLTLQFAADLAGYPGWHWSVTIARVEDGEPTVVETELMPGEQALVAPEWVPWSVRLAEYRAAQAAAAAAAAERGEEVDEEFAEDGFAEDGELDELDADDDDLEDDEDDEDDLDEGESDDEGGDGFDDHDEHFDDHDEAFDGIEIDALDEADADEVDEDAHGEDDDEQPVDGEFEADPTAPRG
jgi:hypothetical protein